MINRLFLYKIKTLKDQLKRHKRDKAFLSTQVNDLRYNKRMLIEEIQDLKLQLAIHEDNRAGGL